MDCNITCVVSENGAGGVTFNGDGNTGQSPGLPHSLSTDPSSSSGTAASTDNSSLTLLQPANNNAASAVSAYTPPTLLPGFSPHYTTGKNLLVSDIWDLRRTGTII